MILVVFAAVSTLGLGSALGVVLARNLVHAALWFVAFAFTLACHFVLLDAGLLAAVQVLVGIGAVAVLILFGIMLTRSGPSGPGEQTPPLRTTRAIPPLVVIVALTVLMVVGLLDRADSSGVATRPDWRERTERRAIAPEAVTAESESAEPIRPDDARTLGEALMTRYVLAFELIGLLLTVAFVGALGAALPLMRPTPTEPSSTEPSTIGAPRVNGTGNGSHGTAVASTLEPLAEVAR